MNWQAILAIVAATSLVGGLIAALFKRMEGHILEALHQLQSDVADLRNHRDKDKERIHKVELAFAEQRAEMAERYASTQALSRLREDCARDIAQMRTYCARKHGEASG